jgi:peptidoglycan hydrolase-like protein with peptidoglycan-binding domain
VYDGRALPLDTLFKRLTRHNFQRRSFSMRRLLVAFLTLLFCAASVSPAAQNAKPSNTSQAGAANAKPAVKRGPVFRSTKEQIKQAQALLKARGFYNGQGDGKLDDDTRAALRKYQEAEALKVTGTLNKVTLEKMGIILTDKQKGWKPAT